MKKLKILVLGGSQFAGRHFVQSCLEKNHEVEVFNRGKSNPSIFPHVKTTHGDRATDLERLGTVDHWDRVVDFCGYHPHIVKNSAQFFKERASKYVYFSSISVYSDFNVDKITEDSPTQTPESSADLIDESMMTYGVRKKACEEAVQEEFSERALILRPGLIVGPHDSTWRFSYWPNRMFEDGNIIVPKIPTQSVQYVDARDIADFILNPLIETATGVFNICGPEMGWDQFTKELTQWHQPQGKFCWVSEEFLKENDVRHWVGLPLWLENEARGMLQASNERATEFGLQCRPLVETLQDTWDWISKGEGLPSQENALSLAREKELIEKLSL